MNNKCEDEMPDCGENVDDKGDEEGDFFVVVFLEGKGVTSPDLFELYRTKDFLLLWMWTSVPNCLTTLCLCN